MVADYKTDRIEADVPEPARRLARTYAPQGRHYQRAVRGALDLAAEPRFELWLLDADRIEPVA